MFSFRQLAVIVFIVLVVLLLQSTVFAPPALSTKEDVQRFILDDLRADPALTAGDHQFRLQHISYDAASGQWSAAAKITLQPHSACPTVYLREYSLLPIRHGVDKVVTENCRPSTVLAFEEEAIIASRSVPEVASLLPSGPYACGFALPLNASAIAEYCPKVSIAALTSFAQSLSSNAAWIAIWQASGQTLFVALDTNGNAVSIQRV